MCVLQVLQRIQIKPRLNIVKWVITIGCEIKINSGRAVYYCEKKLRQQKNVKRRLEMKWMRILVVCHMMLEGTEKFHFLAFFFKFSCLAIKEHSHSF